MPPQAQQVLDTLNAQIPLEAYLIVGALSITKNPATPRKDPDMSRAEWTTFRLRTTPIAQSKVIDARKMNATTT